MADNVPMDLDEIVEVVYTSVENDTDTPAFADDEYQIIRRFANRAIRTWANEKEIQWNELWVTETSGGTINAGNKTYSISTDEFRALGGFITLVNGTQFKKIPVVKATEAQLSSGQDKYAVYLTGNRKDGFELNLLWTPVADDGITGSTIQYDYFKYPSTLEKGSDVPDMSEPEYIVAYCNAKLFNLKRDANSYSAELAEAQNHLLNMRLANETTPNYQEDTIDDLDHLLNGNVLGE